MHGYAPCPHTRNGGSWVSVHSPRPSGAPCGKPTVRKCPSGPAHPPPGRGPHQCGLPGSRMGRTPRRPHSRRQRTVRPVPVSTWLTISRDIRGPPQSGQSTPCCRRPRQRRRLPSRPLLRSPAIRSRRPRRYASLARHRHRHHHNRSDPRPPPPGHDRHPGTPQGSGGHQTHRGSRRRGPCRRGAHGTRSPRPERNPTTISPQPPSQRRRRPRPVSSVTGRRHSVEALGSRPSHTRQAEHHRRCRNATATLTGAIAHLMTPTRQTTSSAEERTRQPRDHRQEARYPHPLPPTVARRPNGQDSHHRTGR